MQHTLTPLINSHDSWSQLKETWLGDVYPYSWYDHLDGPVKEVFYRLTEITKTDLDIIQKTLERFDIIVRRPSYDRIENFLDHKEMLMRPQICPRDHFVVIGNTLYTSEWQRAAWKHAIDHYLSDQGSSVRNMPDARINGANVVRVGTDLILDLQKFDHEILAHDWQQEWPDYRVHLVYNGGHLDGCFAILKPGLVLANHYYQDYDTTFPGWHIIQLDDPTYHAAPSTGYQQPYPVYNGKFWDTTVGTNRAFNQHIIDHALDWVGCYTETFFELNCLVIDPANVIMLAENETLARDLEQHGITVHWVPFRARSFWDGAMHCLTVDIRRDSEKVDYFPERGR